MDARTENSAANTDSANERLRREILAEATRSVIPCVAGLIADRGQHVFSGTFVQRNGEHYVLTARHCLEDIANRESVRIVSAFSGASVGAEGIRGHFWATAPDDPLGSDAPPRIDLGLLWLHKRAAEKLHPQWCGLDRLASGSASPGALVLLLGYPASLSTQSAKLELMTYISEVSGEAPEGLRSEAKQHIDVFIHYDPDDIHDLASLRKERTISPNGFSGCPVFVIRQVEHGEMWTPHMLELAAVQSSFLPGRKLLRATRSELARRTLQDLEEVLARCNGKRPKGYHEFIEPRAMPNDQV